MANDLSILRSLRARFVARLAKIDEPYTYELLPPAGVDLNLRTPELDAMRRRECKQAIVDIDARISRAMVRERVPEPKRPGPARLALLAHVQTRTELTDARQTKQHSVEQLAMLDTLPRSDSTDRARQELQTYLVFLDEWIDLLTTDEDERAKAKMARVTMNGK